MTCDLPTQACCSDQKSMIDSIAVQAVSQYIVRIKSTMLCLLGGPLLHVWCRCQKNPQVVYIVCIHTIRYSRGFVVVMLWFVLSCEINTFILKGCYTGAWVINVIVPVHFSNPEWYGWSGSLTQWSLGTGSVIFDLISEHNSSGTHRKLLSCLFHKSSVKRSQH